MEVTVVRSTRRRKTVELKPTTDGVIISIPAHATVEDEQRYVRQLLARYNLRQHSNEIDLTDRANQLSRKLRLPQPVEIKWVENQKSRWGSCTPATGVIRISNTVAKFPAWVLDYVIAHELAHLEILEHSPDFWDLVNRYDKAERARGFLIAKSLDGTEDDEAEHEPEPEELEPEEIEPEENEEVKIDLRDAPVSFNSSEPESIFEQQRFL